MIIAVASENGEIFQHFGNTPEFKVYTVTGNKIESSKTVSTNGSGHGALIGVLQEIGADIVVCGGIGGGAQNGILGAGMDLFTGVSGNADEVVEAILEGIMPQCTDANCSHHDEEEHHSCTCSCHHH